MPLDIDEDFDAIPESLNPYLAEPRRGLELVARLLAGASRVTDSRINRTVDTMITACDRLMFTKDDHPLKRLSSLVEYFKTSLLESILQENSIVGFGGAFSAGKSAVLNSLMRDGVEFQLPENQSASTSVPTYIFYGEQSRVTACTKKGRLIPLDADAVHALSHEFRTKYALNTAQYLDFIAMALPQFPVRNVTLLDTPGYNASDAKALQEHSDLERSRVALSSIDHLVWLISAEEPLLSDKDARFIRLLNLAGTVTVIVNKCDIIDSIAQSPNPDSTPQLESIRKGFEKAGISYTTVIPYSAREPEWNDGRRKILDALSKVSSKKKNESRFADLENILNTVKEMFQTTLSKDYSMMMQEFDRAIDASANVLDLQAVARLRAVTGIERANLQHDAQLFEKCTKELAEWLTKQKNIVS